MSPALPALVAAIREQASLEIDLICAKALLARVIAEMWNDGAVNGKNADEREAFVRIETDVERQELDSVTIKLVKARAETEIARLYYDASLQTEVQP